MTAASTIRSRLGMTDAQIAAFCEKWHVTEFALFGSIVRDDFTDDSDVDVLVTWAPDKAPGFDFATMHDELSALVGRDVDIVSRRSVELSRNPIRKSSILSSYEVLRAA